MHQPEPLVAAMPERREPPARRSPARGEYPSLRFKPKSKPVGRP